MAINVTVSGGGTIVADVSGADSADVAISGAEIVDVSVAGGIGPAAYINGTNTTVIGVHPVEAGANITVTTTSGSYTIIGRDVPVQSVQGRVGAVVLTLQDLTAASLIHTHSTTQVVGFTAAASSSAPVQNVHGRTGNVVLTLVDLTAAAQVHTHSTTQVVGFTAAAALSAPVQTVQGRTGNVVLTLVDITAAAASHAHLASQVSNLTTVANVVSVNGRTGVVVVSAVDVTAVHSLNYLTGPLSIVAGQNITVSASSATLQISAASAPVFTVQGRTGDVVLTRGDLTAAAVSHAHPYVQNINGSTGSLSISGGVNVTVSTEGTAITVNSPLEIPEQAGYSARVLGTDGTNANWFAINAGSNVTIARNTNSRSILISASGGGGTASGGGTAIWPAIIFGG